MNYGVGRSLLIGRRYKLALCRAIIYYATRNGIDRKELRSLDHFASFYNSR